MIPFTYDKINSTNSIVLTLNQTLLYNSYLFHEFKIKYITGKCLKDSIYFLINAEYCQICMKIFVG